MIRIRWLAITGVVWAILLFPIAPHAGAATYTITDLGTLGGSSSLAVGINESGQVTGYAYPAAGYEHAFLWDSGAMTDLGTLPGDGHSWGMSINATGQVAGLSGTTFVDPDTLEMMRVNHAVLWTSGVPLDLGTLGGDRSEAWGVNDAGDATGWAVTASGQRHPFLWSSGVMTDIGTLGGSWGNAWGINEAGQISGSSSTGDAVKHAYIWDSGVMTDLGTLGGYYSDGYGLNEAGQVVGQSDIDGSTSHAFLWSSGVMTDLGTLGGYWSVAYGINDLGQVVGGSSLATGPTSAFLWEDGVMYDLNTLAAGGSPWTVEYALSINNAGQIAAYGTDGTQWHALLLSPTVPAPGAVVLGMIGVAGLGVFRRFLGGRRS